MATYAIGDVQGCFSALQTLLAKIQFDPLKDFLWFTGDLVNRGPQSLETLRFVKQIGARTVLGNHDLHLLAVAHNTHAGWKEDTFQAILQADDRDELIHWLRHQPLLHHDKETHFVMVHAGLAPSWDLTIAKQLAREVENVLQSNTASLFFQHMYGNEPNQWNPDLQSFDRWRCITNYFTRARFCHPDGRLELQSKGKIDSIDLIPWFKIPHRANSDLKIIFGHWAALGGKTDTPHVYALDTGCIWGYSLTAMRLEDKKRINVDCHSLISR